MRAAETTVTSRHLTGAARFDALTMAQSAAIPLRFERNLILASLLALASLAWALLIWQSTEMGMDMSLTMGMGPALFIAMWAVMMVAMMFPTAAPMILMFAKVHAGRRDSGGSVVPTWVFTGAYIMLWSATGLGAYALAVAGDALADHSSFVMSNSGRIGGLLLISAGIYQLTPLKTVCLSKCRSPIAYIMNSWRDGYRGSFRMGLEHGAYCLGCCWLLFLILFPLGMMNIAILALVTALIFAEKALPIGRKSAQLAALGLVAYGAIVVAVPEALPMMMGDSMGHSGSM